MEQKISERNGTVGTLAFDANLFSSASTQSLSQIAPLYLRSFKLHHQNSNPPWYLFLHHHPTHLSKVLKICLKSIVLSQYFNDLPENNGQKFFAENRESE
ncbi:hypothetical protein OPQ81_003966 [Rhizoctonia solani]|nr:hypothetical protein OPQ81_003966 [Rhizoctonia solani]